MWHLISWLHPRRLESSIQYLHRDIPTLVALPIFHGIEGFDIVSAFVGSAGQAFLPRACSGMVGDSGSRCQVKPGPAASLSMSNGVQVCALVASVAVLDSVLRSEQHSACLLGAVACT